MGALIGAGFTVHIMSSMIAIFLMPIAVVDSVHILSEFSGRYKPGNDLKETVEGVVGHLFTPMLYTSITSSIGFYSLMLTPIPPVQIFGAFVGTGILLAFLITITFIPAFLTRLSDKSLRSLQTTMHSKESSNKLLRFVKSTGRFAIKNRVSLLFVFVAVFVVSVWGVSKIQINDNPVRWFKTDHEIRVADKVLNENFAGTYDAYMVLTSTQPLLSVVEILNKELPHTLFEWVKEQSDAIIEASLHTQYQNMIIIIEDKLFTDLSGEEVNYLENTLQQLETTLSRSKAFQSPELLRYIADLQIHLN
jgi:predicted RND superfamily exporter protein